MKHFHHLKPKHLGGTDDPSNLLEVSLEEHILIHEARYIAYGNWEDKFAYHMLSGQWTKKDFLKEVWPIIGRNVGLSNIGKKQSEDHKKKRVESRKKKGLPFFTDYARQKCIESRKGKAPWNKGLTKDTDERVKRNGEATSAGWKRNRK